MGGGSGIASRTCALHATLIRCGFPDGEWKTEASFPSPQRVVGLQSEIVRDIPGVLSYRHIRQPSRRPTYHIDYRRTVAASAPNVADGDSPPVRNQDTCKTSQSCETLARRGNTCTYSTNIQYELFSLSSKRGGMPAVTSAGEDA